MPKAIFRRVLNNPMTIKINGVPTKINYGDRFIGDFETINGLPGMQFEFYGETLDLESTLGVQISNDKFTITEVIVPQTSTETKEYPFLTTNSDTPTDDPNAEKDCHKCKGKGKYSFGGNYGGPIHWSVCECVMTKGSQLKVDPKFDIDVLTSLKSKTPREWMLVKKHELKKIMDDAGIDYSQVKDERMDLYKFLFTIIKQI
jgi:hypothetical protein